ncbi:MAG: hypothetical protein LBU41_02660 [Clostridiales Family XIII bacterium]|nr:hypothetical protein [Clostridiales Family XIII bacterium]
MSLSSFSNQFGKDFWELFPEETAGLIHRGLLEHEGERIKLTPIGFDLSNLVFAEYV